MTSLDVGATGRPEAPLDPRDAEGRPRPLDVGEILRKKRLFVVGCTGFLGKVWLSMLLRHYPEIGRIDLVVRAKGDVTSEARFWADVVGSPTFDPLREEHPGRALEGFLSSRIFPVHADVSEPLLGLSEGAIAGLRGQVDAVVNVAGVVDFDPPLDEALSANAFGVRNLVELARALGDVPVLHTSTCYVAGYRDGVIEEADPLDRPFPRFGELEAVHWSPEREIAECLDLIQQARHRADDAFRESAFLDEARRTLERRGEPTRGTALQDELEKTRRRFVERRLTEAGRERALYWGFTNIYTYTKSIGEQILATAGRDPARPLPYAIVRPSVIESSVEYPFVGWAEGINTMAPLIYMAMEGHIQIPTSQKTRLDVIPVDMVAGGMILALAALLEGTAPKVAHLASSDVSPYPMHRLIELTGLYKRKHYQNKGKGNLLANLLQAHVEPVPVTTEQYFRHGAPAVSRLAKGLSGALSGANLGPLASVTRPLAKALDGYAGLAKQNGSIWELYIPFMAETDYTFSCEEIRKLHTRLGDDDRRALRWKPETLDWRWYMHEIQLPALEKWVWPEIHAKIARPKKPLRAHDDLLAMLDDVEEKFGLSVALMRLEDEGLTRTTFSELARRVRAAAARLAALGVAPGDRVLLSGKNHPDWVIAYFGVLRAGATAVPIDPAMERARLLLLRDASRAKAALFDDGVRDEAGELGVPVVSLAAITAEDDALVPPEVPRPDEHTVASLLYTSGTTGAPKGVMLTHRNFTQLLASLGPLFPLGPRDRSVSVLPLHHAFEFTCGMLLPLSRGARIAYLDELSGERLREALQASRATAMVGVPALWQMLERRITDEVAAKGALSERAFDALLAANRFLGEKAGLNLGRALFPPVHDALGGNLRWLISGGATLPKETAEVFRGLGLLLAEGYGLTEAAPVLTVAVPKVGGKLGHVGKELPGVSVKIANPDAAGVGEILARGPNVMAGYEGNPEATAAVLSDDGWLRTGDLGVVDKRGNLRIVGRAKEVIVSANGENIYPDDLEAMLGRVPGVLELSVVGVDDPSGGERAVCVAVPSRDEATGRDARRAHALEALRSAIQRLPSAQRPQTVLLYDADLPRTATKKVKRSEVSEIAGRLLTASMPPPSGEGRSVASVVRAAVASVARRKPHEIHASTRLRVDLSFDSLMLVELSAALEAAIPERPVADALATAETVGELEQLLGVAPVKRPESDTKEDTFSIPELPEPVRQAAKRLIGRAQEGFYGRVMRPHVTGRAFVPHDRNVIVVANHSSHLDMGFIKYALGSYGREIVTLAAMDYFFERDKLTRAVVENFTNLAPFDRKAGLRETVRDIGEMLERGKTVLIFPEGTRSADGTLQEFKGAIGHLVQKFHIDVLPVWVGGTHRAMPKGQPIPLARDVTARIGPVLRFEDVLRLTAGQKPSQAARLTAKICQRAIERLRDGEVLDLERATLGDVDRAAAHPMVTLFGELPERFVPGATKVPVSFYFTLGAEDEAKWTVRVDAARCDVIPGKPEGGTADCVLKTSPEMFTRIVREGYTPGVPEFVSGLIKSNDIGLLQTFQRVFALGGAAS